MVVACRIGESRVGFKISRSVRVSEENVTVTVQVRWADMKRHAAHPEEAIELVKESG
jgi:hypothetical protein